MTQQPPMTRLLALLGRGLRRWLQLLGENPPLSHDCSPLPWHLVELPELLDEGAPGPEKAPGFHLHLRSL